MRIHYILWIIMWSHFECILHNLCDFKHTLKHILQCIFAFSVCFIQYTDGCIWYIIIACTTSFTLIVCWKLTVIDKCVFCELYQNSCIDGTEAYIKTMINFQEDPQGTHFSLSMFNTSAMVITDDTHSHFSNSFISVSFTLLG